MPDVVTPSLLADIFTTFDSKLNDVYGSTETLKEQISMTIPTSGASTKHGWMKEIPGMREFIGSREVHTLEANGYEIENKEYELTLGVRRSVIEDDQVGVYTPWLTLAGASAALEPDYQAFDLLVDGFTKTGYDSVTFFNNSHLWKGLTVDNLYTDSLDANAFADAKQRLRATVSRRGANGEPPLIPNPQFRLIVGPELETTARQIIEMEYVNGGDSNVNRGAADLLVTGYLHENAGASRSVDARNYWFVEVINAPGGIMPFIFQERTPLRTTQLFSDTDFPVFDKEEFEYGLYRRFGVGYGLFQLIVGSTSAGA